MSVQLPIDYALITRTLVAMVQGQTGLVCINAESEVSGAGRPKLPYFSLKITTPGAQMGDDSVERDPATSIVTVQGPRKMSVSLQCYARNHEEAYTYMAAIQSKLGGSEAVWSQLRAIGVAVWDYGNVVDLSALLNTGYEGRAQMDAHFGILSVFTEDQGAIDQMTANGSVAGQADAITYP